MRESSYMAITISIRYIHTPRKEVFCLSNAEVVWGNIIF